MSITITGVTFTGGSSVAMSVVTAASETTGSPTITVTGGYRYYIWTSSGSITF